MVARRARLFCFDPIRAFSPTSRASPHGRPLDYRGRQHVEVRLARNLAYHEQDLLSTKGDPAPLTHR